MTLLVDEIRRRYQSVTGEDRVHHYWDLLDAADVRLGLPDQSPEQTLSGHRRFEEWVHQRVFELS